MERSRVAVIIEDEEHVRDLIAVVFKHAGFVTHAAQDGETGVALVRQHDPMVVTVDIEMGDMDGFEAARRIRLFSDSYIIMLTGRDEEADAMAGLDNGADDYIIKPFRPRELRSRINALLRRPRWQEGTESSAGQLANTGKAGRRSKEVLEHNGILLNTRTRKVQVDGTDLELSTPEFDLLHTLMESTWVHRSNADLAQKLRAAHYETGEPISRREERAIDFLVMGLREKLGDTERPPRWLKAEPGGYSLMV
ncbi:MULTISPECIES: response regulator transcription factor [unclassified Arthrobacter]|uniref:response regulator transcription factor n=1 Tax=unclassified Arthrobacter TaxID=235627 RepID=UPI001C845C77|nr:response regulator transcription factor [Arthrobacter sp. MAHUQ-56]MBX7443365.1 response regulator transcription factor [Arthrobacter sp. MAHUQ-56]